MQDPQNFWQLPVMSAVSREITRQALLDADEIWSTGNHAKVVPITKIEDRALQPGPKYQMARDLYWQYARETARY